MNSAGRTMGARMVVAAVAAAILGLATTVAAVSILIKVRGRLSATDVDPDARGRARLVLRDTTDGRFDLIARRLAARSAFDVIVRRVKVATLHTAGDGHGRVRFRSHPRGRDVLLGFDPRGAHIVVRDGDGEDVLDGIMPDEPFAPGEMACCLPDPEEIEDDECEGRTAAACASAGGTVVVGAPSCLPNPCAGVTPSDATTVCCLPESSQGAFVDPDEDGDVECEDVSEPACLAAGGTVVHGESCELDPCEPISPHAEVVCCVPECEVVTPESCGAQGGTVVAASSCAGDPCGEGVD